MIERISARIDALEISLRAEIRAESLAVRNELRADIRGEGSAIRSELRDEFRAGFVEHRRHTDIQFESVRDDIRMLAEAFATMSVKLDSLQR